MDDYGDVYKTEDTNRAWVWCIEYLASSPLITSSFLHDVVEATPESLDDELGERAREAVALRCLKELFCGSSSDRNPGLDASLDCSKSCQDVLQSVLQGISVSDLREGRLGKLKQDVHPFVTHKRASLPKSTLEQLKEVILDGSYPHAASWKVLGGMGSANGEINYGNWWELLYHVDGSGLGVNSTSEPIGNDKGVVENGSQRKTLCSKRDRTDPADKILERDYSKSQGDVDSVGVLHSKAKKARLDTSCASPSMEQNAIPANNVFDGREKCCRPEKAPLVGGRDISQVVENGNGEQVVSKSANADNKDSLCHQETNQHVTKIARDATGAEPCIVILDDVAEPRTSGCESAVQSQQKVHGDKPKTNSRLESCGELVSEDLSDIDAYNHEKVDVGKEKTDFLSSQQCTLVHNPLETNDWIAQKLCVKCGKQGNLLACSVGGCPLVVHGDCLGASARFDERKNFYCPFCSYSLAISDYFEAKKRAFLARKELVTFMSSKGLGNDTVGEMVHGSAGENDREETVLESQFNGNGNKLSCEDQDIAKQNQARALGNSERKQLSSPEKIAAEIDGADGLSNDTNGEDKMDKIVRQCASIAGMNSKENQAQTTPVVNGNDVTCEDQEAVSQNNRQAEGVLGNKSLDASEKPVCAVDVDGRVATDDENDNQMISDYCISFRKRDGDNMHTTSPQLKRKHVAWSAEEEEMLKEGVLKFAGANDKIVPWKQILEYGSAIFSNVRTPTDLKNKWRSIRKENPKSNRSSTQGRSKPTRT